MTTSVRTACLALAAVIVSLLATILAAPAGAAARKPGGGEGTLLPGASSKEPVSIDAGKLDYFDKDQKLVYTGEVVARQGDTTLKASMLTIFLTKGPPKIETAEAAPPAAEAAAPTSGNSIRRMEAAGPVTIVSKDEVGTGDNGVYDKATNRITLTGNVALTQATNIIKGDKLVYDMTSGQAQVTSGQTSGRVRSVFTPGSGTPGGPAAKKQKAGGKADAAAGATP